MVPSETLTITSDVATESVTNTSSSFVSLDAELGSLQTIRKEIGDGPCRFAPDDTERTLVEQIDSLCMEEKMCFHNLKIKWEEDLSKEPFASDDWYLRFARCSPGDEKYNEKSAWKVMCNFNRKYDKLTAEVVEKQLMKKTIFPIPGLVSKDGHEFFYVRPSLYFPKLTSSKVILHNLVYVINTMCEKERNCTEGIAMIFNMKDFNRKENYSTEYIYQFLKILKGSVPVRIRLCLIVDAPVWFQNVWTVLSVTVGRDFRQKTHLITSDKLPEYLPEGFEKFLPYDVQGIGMADTDAIVSDFITYRKYIEEKRHLPHYFESSKEDNLYEGMFTNDDNNTCKDTSTIATAECTSFDTTLDKSLSLNDDDEDETQKNRTEPYDGKDGNNNSFNSDDETMEYYQPQGTIVMM